MFALGHDITLLQFDVCPKAFPGGSIGKASIFLFWRLTGSSPTQGGKLVVDACDQQPLDLGEWGLRVR